jgi:hypothetical protein
MKVAVLKCEACNFVTDTHYPPTRDMFCLYCGKKLKLSHVYDTGSPKKKLISIWYRLGVLSEVYYLGLIATFGFILWLKHKNLRDQARAFLIGIFKEGYPGRRKVTEESRRLAHEILHYPGLWNPSPAEDLLKLTEEALSELPEEQLKELLERIKKLIEKKGIEKARKEIRFERKPSCLFLTVEDKSTLIPFDV